MRRIVFISVLVCLFISCQKSLYWPDEATNNVIALENARLSRVVTNQTLQTRLNGQVLDEMNQPVTGATVLCGTKTAVTDNKGFFRFKDVLEVNKHYALIKVEKAGFMNGFRTFAPNQTELAYHFEKIVLQSTPASQAVPATGGTITGDNVKLTFPADAIVRTDGSAYSGNVNVKVRYINPSSPNFGFMMPGVLAGLNSNDQINAMQSFGMANVELKDDAGQKLEIATGKTVRMEMPAAASAPATIPLWHFNEDYGIWVQQGTATKAGNSYIAEVNHFSIWNLDLEFNDFVLNLKFKTNDTTAVANQLVSVYKGDSAFVQTFYTDNAGEATLINCPSNEGLTLRLHYSCDTLVYNLPALTQSRTDTLMVTDPEVINYQLAGTISGCNNQLLPNQAFEMMLTGVNGSFIVLNGISDAEGNYNISTIVPICESTSFTVQTVAEYNNQYYFTPATPVAQGLNDYNPVLCDVATNSVTLQPATNPNELNFAGYANGTNISAHLKELCAGMWTNAGNEFYMRGALRFDLSSIPAGATIVSAKLTLYSIPDPQNGDQVNANLGQQNSIYIQRITQNWDAATATWSTQPTTTTNNQVSVPHTSQNFLDLVDLNVTAMVRDMQSQGNYGFQMRLQTESLYNIRQFASSMHVNTALHPKLVVVYQQ